MVIRAEHLPALSTLLLYVCFDFTQQSLLISENKVKSAGRCSALVRTEKGGKCRLIRFRCHILLKSLSGIRAGGLSGGLVSLRHPRRQHSGHAPRIPEVRERERR